MRTTNKLWILYQMLELLEDAIAYSDNLFPWLNDELPSRKNAREKIIKKVGLEIADIQKKIYNRLEENISITQDEALQLVDDFAQSAKKSFLEGMGASTFHIDMLGRNLTNDQVLTARAEATIYMWVHFVVNTLLTSYKNILGQIE